MHKKGLIILLLILATTIGYSQSENIKIKSEHLKEANYLKMDDFYLTHYLYIDLFLRENLFPTASPEEVSTILKAIKTYVSVDTPLEIEIEKPGDRNYVIKMAILKKDDGTELLIAFTNWSTKERKFEKEIKTENDSYTRWYFLNDNKMTYRKDMSAENDYETMSKSDLANAYLFDELSDNDTKIKSTIDDALEESNVTVVEDITSHLILLKHQIFLRDHDNIATQTDYINELIETNETEFDLRGVKMAFIATKFQIELMK
ncbi:hypothetical protein [Winogradskyella thalassocola]|uniref:Uncharacterized protein n=1 Tax=Winogradskyella thalassocola TaxID=262004 RepID=A0A1G8D308_9FLAO|nr:hypothetical protein [Winogradskyella thalassocola]SDH52145.1 hypothetical protein SAMN04489796_103110 [Winogradskyella thalassocola]